MKSSKKTKINMSREKAKLYACFMNCCQNMAILWLTTKNNEDVFIDCRNPDYIVIDKKDQYNISGKANDMWNLLCDMEIDCTSL